MVPGTVPLAFTVPATVNAPESAETVTAFALTVLPASIDRLPLSSSNDRLAKSPPASRLAFSAAKPDVGSPLPIRRPAR